MKVKKKERKKAVDVIIGATHNIILVQKKQSVLLETAVTIGETHYIIVV